MEKNFFTVLLQIGCTFPKQLRIQGLSSSPNKSWKWKWSKIAIVHLGSGSYHQCTKDLFLFSSLLSGHLISSFGALLDANWPESPLRQRGDG